MSIDGAAATEKPWIDAPVMPTNVTVVAGRTAILACVVKDVGTASVRRTIFQKINCMGSAKRWAPGCVNATGKAR